MTVKFTEPKKKKKKTPTSVKNKISLETVFQTWAYKVSQEKFEKHLVP